MNNMSITQIMDIVELNKTNNYDMETVAKNYSVHVLASHYLAYKIGKSI